VPVWLTLGIGAIGSGGMFAVYSYITPMLVDVDGIRESIVPLVLCAFGTGMIAGNVVSTHFWLIEPCCPRLAVFSSGTQSCSVSWSSRLAIRGLP
jgi:predicted MFS family arabinose efflux permease